MHKRRVTRALLAASLAVGLLASTEGVANAGKTEDAPVLPANHLTYEGTHPWSAAQPTLTGRTLTDLHVKDDKVYAGYGDYGANTGPITVAAYDSVTDTFVEEFVSDTEAVYNLRTIGDRLVAPAIDRRSAADYAASGPWADHRPIATSHAFDMVTLDGTDLWLVGSKGLDAVAWRSIDGGETWVEMRRVSPISGSAVRFYFALVLDGRLYLQAMESGAGMHPTSLVFDGSEWSDGPDLLPSGGFGWRPVPFGDGVVYHSIGHAGGGFVYFFDGASVTTLGTGFDLEVDGDSLYVLNEDMVVRATTDLLTWTALTSTSSDARSIATTETELFVGDQQSRLWSMPLPAATGADPTGTIDEPTTTTTLDEPTTTTTLDAPTNRGGTKSDTKGRVRPPHPRWTVDDHPGRGRSAGR